MTTRPHGYTNGCGDLYNMLKLLPILIKLWPVIKPILPVILKIIAENKDLLRNLSNRPDTEPKQDAREFFDRIDWDDFG